MKAPSKTHRLRFGDFEADLRTCELRKHGLRIKLQDQPFQVLALLLQRHGEMVSREELRQNLWPEDTFVDFDVGLNNAIKRLRDALGDPVEHPRFVETLPRRGYRFIAPIENGAASGEAGLAIAPAAEDLEPKTAVLSQPAVELTVPSAAQPGTRWLWITAPVFVVLLVVVIGVNPGGWRNRLLPRSPAGSIQSIAVLPLENLTGDPAQEYFADGMTDAMITDLARVSSLRVISRTSAMRYKGSGKPLGEIARELNVDAFVEGSVVRSGNRVRINAQLIQAVPERHLWANAYERDLADVVALQGDVARAIVTEIQIKLTPQELARLAGPRRVNPEAYEAYLKGRYYWEKRNEPAINTAIEYFEQAIKIDPNFALAYAGLADAYYIAGFGVVASMPRAEAAAKGKAAALRALELDDSLAEAHTALAVLKEEADRDWPGAEVEFRRALELNPGYANACLWYSQFLRQMGRRDEDFAMTRRALQLDPMSPIMLRNMGLALWWWGDVDQAIEQFRRALEIDPNRFNVLLVLGWAYMQKGMYAEATAELQKALTLSPGNILAEGGLAYVYAVTGRRAEAEKILNQLKKLPKERGASYFIAIIYVGLGRNEEALGWLEEAVEDHSVGSWQFAKNWELDPLRKDPQFQELMRRAEMAENRIRK
jgi:TolB-like protein/DNA-binding winged helix-turn-helix (wHTH) protein/Tfp pilus assembly protein PilF